MLKKGDPCYVRMPDGEIYSGKYIEKVPSEKWHWVMVGMKEYCAVGSIDSTSLDFECRFVCMTGIKGKYNEKQS